MELKAVCFHSDTLHMQSSKKKKKTTLTVLKNCTDRILKAKNRKLKSPLTHHHQSDGDE